MGSEMCIRDRYDIDTSETFIVTQLHDKPLNIVTTFVQSVHPSPAHKHEDAATPLVNCIVNDGLVNAVPNMHQTLLEFVNVVHQ